MDLEKLLALQIPDTAQSYGFKDSLLYAVSLGYGSDPLDGDELKYAFEGIDRPQQVAPSMGVILAHPGYWPRTLDSGLDWVRIVHAEQGLELHKPLPPAAHVIGRSRIVGAVDKGKEKGALITYERKIFERDSGDALCTITQVMLARGDGGFGGVSGPAAAPPMIPDRAADRICELPTSPQMALLYRLNADWNPLHADPTVAKKAGFERPILHGLATWGVAVRAVLRGALNYESDRIASIFGRFSAPVYPGETLRTEMWMEAEAVAFRVWAVERNVMVINNGRIGLRA